MSPYILLEQIVAQRNPNSARAGILVNKLLKEFRRGYPLENLRSYLRSDDPRRVDVGIWIASELGQHAKALLDDVSPLLTHSHKKVRFFAIDCILLWAAPSNTRQVAAVIGLIEDPQEAVRWKVLDFLARASREQLQGALLHLLSTGPDSKLASGLEWLLGPDAKKSNTILSSLHDASPLARKYAAVAAARIANENPEPLREASLAEDPDVKTFAESTLRLL